MANYRNYSGPNAAGTPKNKIPDWLDHTPSAKSDQNKHDNKGAHHDPGPNQQSGEQVSKGT